MELRQTSPICPILTLCLILKRALLTRAYRVSSSRNPRPPLQLLQLAANTLHSVPSLHPSRLAERLPRPVSLQVPDSSLISQMRLLPHSPRTIWDTDMTTQRTPSSPLQLVIPVRVLCAVMALLDRTGSTSRRLTRRTAWTRSRTRMLCHNILCHSDQAMTNQRRCGNMPVLPVTQRLLHLPCKVHLSINHLGLSLMTNSNDCSRWQGTTRLITKHSFCWPRS